jgi:hypothetical protein
MSQESQSTQQERRHFFISYTRQDQAWAEWIAMQLETAGYTTFLQAWDVQPGANFLAEMDQAAQWTERTLLVLSAAFLQSSYTFVEWAAAYRRDPKGTQRRLLPVRIESCEIEGLLGSIVYIDLVSLDEARARERLLAGVLQGRMKPATVAFPGQGSLSHIPPTFPGSERRDSAAPTIVGKQVTLRTPVKESNTRQAVKALFLAANPATTNHLAIDEEMRAIEQKVRAADHRDVLVFQSAWAVRPDDLLQLLNQHRPQIVHFRGHGSHAGLSLTGNDGQERVVSTQALRALFTTLKDQIRLVFLNACYSQEQAQALATTIDCVVGMQQSVRDDAAAIFASAFYRALGFGRSIQEAFDQGRTALLLEGIPEEDVPVLLVRDGVDPARVVFIGETANPS